MAQALLSQGELLELRVELARVRAQLERSRAVIDAVVGPAVEVASEN
ncbi:MAG: hypothetical protein AAFY60_16480 [Myxococcota bacterium]